MKLFARIVVGIILISFLILLFNGCAARKNRLLYEGSEDQKHRPRYQGSSYKPIQ